MGAKSIKQNQNIFTKYKEMYLINPYRFGIYVPPVTPNNTFINGVASVVTNEIQLASKLLNYPSGTAFDPSNIQNFTIIGNDIECLIEINFTTNVGAFLNSNLITSFIHTGNYFPFLNYNGFINAPNFRVLESINSTLAGYPILGGNNQLNIERVYLPNVVNYGNNYLNNSVFIYLGQQFQSLRAIFYVNSSMETINAGGIEGDLAYLISQGAEVRFIQNLTAPNTITDLTIGTVYATALQLNFTAPTGSINAIDFYEVWIDGRYNNKGSISNLFAIGLTPNTSYNIEVKPVDIYYNKSTSNIVTQITSAIYVIPTANIVSNWQMENNVLDSVGSNHGTATDITYETGIVGQRSVFNGVTSKIQLSTIPLSTEMSFVMRVKNNVHIPTIISKTGLLDINVESANSNTHYPFTNGNIYLSLLTSVRKNVGTGIIIDRTQEHTITVTANTTTNVWRFYQNNVLVFTDTVGTLTMSTIAILGKSFGAYFYDGKQDEVSILNTELNAGQVSDITAKLSSGQHLI